MHATNLNAYSTRLVCLCKLLQIVFYLYTTTSIVTFVPQVDPCIRRKVWCILVPAQ